MKSFQTYLKEMKLKVQYHETLNPTLFKDSKLDKEVRSKLLKFAKAWQQFANIPDDAVRDVVMTGGNANYNYTDISDIDVHLEVDKSKIAKDNPLLDDYLQSKKVLWTLSHDIKIKGYPVEPYAHDYTEGYPENQGVYSLKHNHWVQEPKYLGSELIDDKLLKKKVKFYKKMIDEMIKGKTDVASFYSFLKKIRDMRGAGIQKGGEFSFENFLFKELRNRGYFDKIYKYTQREEDKALSL